MENYGVFYSSEEEERERKTVFTQNVLQIPQHAYNLYDLARPSTSEPRSYDLDLNRFSDMTWCVRAYVCSALLTFVCVGVDGDGGASPFHSFLLNQQRSQPHAYALPNENQRRVSFRALHHVYTYAGARCDVDQSFVDIPVRFPPFWNFS